MGRWNCASVPARPSRYDPGRCALAASCSSQGAPIVHQQRLHRDPGASERVGRFVVRPASADQVRGCSAGRGSSSLGCCACRVAEDSDRQPGRRERQHRAARAVTSASTSAAAGTATSGWSRPRAPGTVRGSGAAGSSTSTWSSVLVGDQSPRRPRAAPSAGPEKAAAGRPPAPPLVQRRSVIARRCSGTVVSFTGKPSTRAGPRSRPGSSGPKSPGRPPGRPRTPGRDHCRDRRPGVRGRGRTLAGPAPSVRRCLLLERTAGDRRPSARSSGTGAGFASPRKVNFCRARPRPRCRRPRCDPGAARRRGSSPRATSSISRWIVRRSGRAPSTGS